MGGMEETPARKEWSVFIARNALDIYRELDLPFCNTVHDELHYLVPEAEAEKYAARILEIMCTPKDWFSGIPVAAEGKLSPFYNK